MAFSNNLPPAVLLAGASLLLFACNGADPTAPEEPRREPVPEAEAEPAPEAEPRAGRLELETASVAWLEGGPGEASEGLLLLHGGRFRASTWRELGTFEALAASRPDTRVVAVDLPGFGDSTWRSGGRGSSEDRAQLLADLLDALGLERAVVVSPSMSGCWLLPFHAGHPERLAGIVPVAPACAEAARPAPSVPALVLWGSEDGTFPVEGAPALAGALAGAPGAGRVEIFEGAGHPCYLDDPERFHRLLSDFVAEALAR